MPDLPPGILYLAQRLPKLAIPPTIVYVLVLVLRSRLEVDIPAWAATVAVVLSLPVLLTVKIQWALFADHRAAARHGAVIPPYIPDQYPGGLGFLLGAARENALGYPGEWVQQICEKLGYALTIRVFFSNRIVTAEPEHIKAILATQFDDFEKGSEIRRRLTPLLGTGVFAADGELWKFHRSMTRPFFTKDRISHFELFDRLAGNAIGQIKARLREGHPVDFQDVIARFTLDAATDFLLGSSVDSLSEGLPYPFYHTGEKPSHPKKTSTSQFITSFSAAQDLTYARIRIGDHWPLGSFWKDELKDHMKVVYDFIDPMVAAAVKKKHESVSDKHDDNLLENLVHSTEDPIILRDEIMNLLVAGRDTTASLLTFAVYMLSQHPDVLRRLREEIVAQVGPSGQPTYEDFRNMKYLRAVLNETLRLYPPVPTNLRVSKRATLIPSRSPGSKPIYIPQETRIPFTVMVMHRREDLWGPDVLEFDPDRFLDERLQKYLTPNPFIFLPFNAGPRICLGQQFAYHEASFFLVRFLQNFSTISLAPEAQPLESRPPAQWASSPNQRVRNEKIKPKAHLTMYVQGGLWVTMDT